ncbi:MAG: endonuclease domain-containing protein [Chitinispirillaceae bacterium]|nr:endonuclease domain-containing protein [Chitinispirillaceae bacterium]
MNNTCRRNPNPSGVVLLQRIDGHKIQQARALRKKMTPQERIFWERIRANKILGLQFRRQQPIEGFIVDFYCNKARCVVEIDGSIHTTREQRQRDNLRRRVFENRGLTEMRFTNYEINHELDIVIARLEKTLTALLSKR